MLRTIRPLALLTAIALCVALLGASPPAVAKKKADAQPMDQKKDELLAPGTFAGLSLRGIGPAVTSGRIIDFALHPDQPSVWWVASASGGVWKSENSGTTWTPVFDGQGSYSIGCLAIDPDNPNVVWVGTGENNSQRSVSYGDGVYKTEDGGKTWTEHRAEGLPAHRQDRHRPARHRRGLRGGPGAALERRRRPGSLQDHRRRGDLDQGARDLQRTPASPTSSWTHATRTPSTPPPTSGAAASGP